MPFRNPLYLDLPLLQNLAEYYSIDVGSETEVTRRRLDQRTGKAGVDKVIALGGERGSADEVTEVFKKTVRPIRAMNDVIDTLLDESDLVDLTTDSTQPFGQRDVVQVEGDLSLSPITEIGALTASLFPVMFETLAAGKELDSVDNAALGQVFLGGTAAQAVTHVFELGNDLDVSLYVLVEPSHVHETSSIDDLEGELTVLGAVDRVVAPGNSFSLEKYLLPSLPRVMRRAMGGDGVKGLLESSSKIVGRHIDEREISVEGPAAVIRAIAIY